MFIGLHVLNGNQPYVDNGFISCARAYVSVRGLASVMLENCFDNMTRAFQNKFTILVEIAIAHIECRNSLFLQKGRVNDGNSDVLG